MIKVHVHIPVKLTIKLGFYVGGILRVVMLHNSKTWIIGERFHDIGALRFYSLIEHRFYLRQCL